MPPFGTGWFPRSRAHRQAPRRRDQPARHPPVGPRRPDVQHRPRRTRAGPGDARVRPARHGRARARAHFPGVRLPRGAAAQRALRRPAARRPGLDRARRAAPRRRAALLVGMSSTFMDQADLLRRVVAALDQLPVRGLVTTGPAIEPSAPCPAPRASVVYAARRGTAARRRRGQPWRTRHRDQGPRCRSAAAGTPARARPAEQRRPRRRSRGGASPEEHGQARSDRRRHAAPTRRAGLPPGPPSLPPCSEPTPRAEPQSTSWKA